MERIKNDRNKRELILGLFTFAAFMVLYIFTNFKTAAGINAFLKEVSYLLIASIAMTMIILTGNIDISAGTMMGLCGYTAAYLSQKGFSFLVFIPAAIIVGVLFASINGILITKFKVPAMVATLAMVNVHLGIFILLPHGGWVENLQSNFTMIGKTSFFAAIPLVFVLSLVLTAILLWFMKYSRFSKKIYAVGGNSEAAILSGIQPEKVIMQTYILEGILIGIASVLFYTPKSIVQANSTHGMEMLFITATVVGGTNIAGGEGRVTGTIIGVILVALINRSMIFLGLQDYYSFAVQGAIILIAVLTTAVDRGKLKKKLSSFKK